MQNGTAALNPPETMPEFDAAPVGVITGYVCDQCKTTPVEYSGFEICDTCKQSNLKAANNTKMEPTSGEFIAEVETHGIGGRSSYRVRTKGWASDTLAIVCPQGKSPTQLASDTVMVTMTRDMWDHILFLARKGDVECGRFVADADAMFQKLTSEDEEGDDYTP